MSGIVNTNDNRNEQPPLKSPIESRKNSARNQSAHNNGTHSPNNVGKKKIGDINKS